MTRDGLVPALLQAAVNDTSPGIFTATQNGTGQGAILVNAGLGVPVTSVNNADNPAPQGSVISIFATGSGVWNPMIPSGTVVLGYEHSNKGGDNYVPAAVLISLTIGGQPAKVTYAGPAPYMPAGVIQINAVVPTGIRSGPQPIVLTIGANSNSQQNVTVAVQ